MQQPPEDDLSIEETRRSEVAGAVSPFARGVEALRSFVDLGGGYPLLLTLCFAMDLRRILAIAWGKGGGSVLGAADFVNFLTLAEWWCLYEIARPLDWSGLRANRWERLIGLGFAAYALFFVVLQSHVLTIAVGFGMAIKLALSDGKFRPLALGLALISIQEVFGKEIFGFSLNEAVAQFDARGAEFLLSTAGYAIEREGTALHQPGVPEVIRVVATCATTVPLPETLAAFGIFAIWMRAEITWRLAALAGILTVAVFQINWMRLAIVTFSQEHYAFWHDGTGRAMIGMSYVVLAFFLATLAAPAPPKKS
jgi:hypothetical protein